MTENPTHVGNGEIPVGLDEKPRTALRLETAPETRADWTDATADRSAFPEVEVGYQVLCSTAESYHVAVVDGDRQDCHCVLDTLVSPFVVEGKFRFDVRSESPVSDSVLELVVTADGVEATPADTVVSLGTASDPTVPHEREFDHSVAYDQCCP